MTKNFFIALIILGITGIFIFKAIDPVERSAKINDQAKLDLIESIHKTKQTPPDINYDEINIPLPLKNTNLQTLFKYKKDTSGFIIYTKLNSRANYSRCNVASPVAWAVYSSFDDHSGVVCISGDKEPDLGRETYLP